ncbi:MAG TPA: RHS repeat-associated core domain-containing protein [Terriglobia bacterium]|nr:RHS repeat-associated core domain-containing protein [Terriglobia bacterium]
MTDANGVKLDDCDYLPFGQMNCITSSSGNDYLYTGLERDADQLDHTLHRQYSSSFGRWMSPDPGGVKVVNMDTPETWNLYAYVADNPTTDTDPTGLAGQDGSSGGCVDLTTCPDDRPLISQLPLEQLNTGVTKNIANMLTAAVQGAQVIVTAHNQNNTQQTLHYKKGVSPASGALKGMLGCAQSCVGSPLTVTSTTDVVRRNGRIVAHGSNTPHGRGEAADVRANRGNAGKILSCGAVCGAKFGLNEVTHPSAHATGPHVHLQITPGRNGGRGDLPRVIWIPDAGWLPAVP